VCGGHVGKRAPDGTFNAIGKVVKKTDPLGRETHYIYGTNNAADDHPCLTSATLCTGMGIDLLEARQVSLRVITLIDGVLFALSDGRVVITKALA
jgi:hypothetical protein